MPLIIDTIVVAELDSVFTMACLMFFYDNYKTVLVRLCIYLFFFSNRNEDLHVSCTYVCASYLASQ